MNADHFEALVIDEHFGELTPEVSALLHAYLAAHPEARAQAADIRATLSLAKQTLEQHPELARVTAAEAGLRAPLVQAAPRQQWKPLAAAAALALLAAAGGFHYGSQRSSPPPVVAQEPAAPAQKSPWTRYRMVIDPQGQGMQVVRVDEPKQAREVYQ